MIALRFIDFKQDWITPLDELFGLVFKGKG